MAFLLSSMQGTIGEILVNKCSSQVYKMETNSIG